MTRKTFKKSERLHKKKLIQELFTKGSSFYLYPFKVISLPHREETANHQVLISVSKRSHRTAVARNKIKRRMREAYRLNKQQLDTGNHLLIAYIYTSKEVLDYHEVEKKMIRSFSKLKEAYQ